jgi:hypothetical protein
VAGEDRWQFRSMVNWLRKGDGKRVANLPVQFRGRGGVVMDVAVTVQPVRDREGVLRSLRWVLRDVALAGPERFVADDQMAVERDDARTQHLEALAELDPAADLDGMLQVLLDAGVRLLDVDGVGLMLVDGEGRLCAAGGSDEASLAFLRAQEHLVKGPCWHALLVAGDLPAA